MIHGSKYGIRKSSSNHSSKSVKKSKKTSRTGVSKNLQRKNKFQDKYNDGVAVRELELHSRNVTKEEMHQFQKEKEQQQQLMNHFHHHNVDINIPQKNIHWDHFQQQKIVTPPMIILFMINDVVLHKIMVIMVHQNDHNHVKDQNQNLNVKKVKRVKRIKRIKNHNILIQKIQKIQKTYKFISKRII